MSFATVTSSAHYLTHNGVEYPLDFEGAGYIDPRVVVEGESHSVTYAVADTDCTDFEWGDVRFFQADPSYVSPHAQADVEAMAHVFLVEKYEHGMIRYALTGESSAVDRAWDVSGAVGIIGLPEDCTDPEGAARAWLAEYTSWCNGDVYGVITERFRVVEGENVAFPLGEGEACWGVIGSEYAQECVNAGGA